MFNSADGFRKRNDTRSPTNSQAGSLSRLPPAGWLIGLLALAISMKLPFIVRENVRAPQVAVDRRADDPSLGTPTAPVELVMFGDFQGSAYARLAAVMPRVRELFGARLRVVFKPMPADDAASVDAAEGTPA